MARKKGTRGHQQGAQRHAEGEHGVKTREFIRKEQITTRVNDDEKSGPVHDPAEIARHNTPGKDRLFQDRHQHDPAEKNSEQTRVIRDVRKHGHESAKEVLKKNRVVRSRWI